LERRIPCRRGEAVDINDAVAAWDALIAQIENDLYDDYLSQANASNDAWPLYTRSDFHWRAENIVKRYALAHPEHERPETVKPIWAYQRRSYWN
jgi:hypothetical protein